MPHGRCKLCLEYKALCSSHYIPAAVYRTLSSPALKNQHPLAINRTLGKQSSEQVQDYVFCKLCEQLLNRNGEAWVMSRMAKRSTFPLRRSVSKIIPVELGGGVRSYDLAKLSDIRAEKIAHFGLGMFWRGAIHDWQWLGQTEKRFSLGTYENDFRLYLIGQARFPRNTAMIVFVWPFREVLFTAYAPGLGRSKPMHSFSFYIPGLTFTLYTGRMIPAGLRDMCIASSKHPAIYSSESSAWTLLRSHKRRMERLGWPFDFSNVHAW
jgi:hypothetical protein